MQVTAGAKHERTLFALTLVAVVVVDVVLRAHELVSRTNGVATSQFDEGVYTTAAASFVRGAVPYRDFVFLHPPGIAILLSPFVASVRLVGSWADALYVARWLMVLISIADVVLVAVLAYRWRGWFAAAVAGLLHATYLPAVHTEGHVMLEPVVTLGLLVGAFLWLGDVDEPRSRRRTAAAGVVAALTVLTKLTGFVVLVAMLVVDRPTASASRDRRRMLAWAAGTAAVVALPFVVLAGPLSAFRQVVWTQARRPGGDVGGGTIQGLRDRVDHLGSFGPFALSHAGAWAGVAGAVLVAGVVVWAWRRGGPIGRFFAVTVATGCPLVLFAPDYYDQYPVTAFAGIAVLVGGAAAAAVDALLPRRVGLITAGVVAACVLLGAADSAESVAEDVRDHEAHDRAAGISAAIGGSCVSADLPDVLLAIDRLPPRDASGRRFVDPFGAEMYAAIRTREYDTTPEALNSERAQARLRQTFDACPFAITYGTLDATPPRWADATVGWFKDRYEVVTVNDAGLALWRRR